MQLTGWHIFLTCSTHPADFMMVPDLLKAAALLAAVQLLCCFFFAKTLVPVRNLKFAYKC